MLLFLVDLINIEIFRISFSFFYSFSFILHSRATSVNISDEPFIKLLDQFITYFFTCTLSRPLYFLFTLRESLATKIGVFIYTFIRRCFGALNSKYINWRLVKSSLYWEIDKRKGKKKKQF